MDWSKMLTNRQLFLCLRRRSTSPGKPWIFADIKLCLRNKWWSSLTDIPLEKMVKGHLIKQLLFVVDLQRGKLNCRVGRISEAADNGNWDADGSKAKKSSTHLSNQRPGRHLHRCMIFTNNVNLRKDWPVLGAIGFFTSSVWLLLHYFLPSANEKT